MYIGRERRENEKEMRRERLREKISGHEFEMEVRKGDWFGRMNKR